MRIGIGVPNQVRDVDPALIPLWAADAERAAFSTAATIGRIAYPGVMDTVAMAAAAGATSTIELMTAVTIGPAWPAALLAKELAAIQGVSGGRLTAGLGLGARRDDFIGSGHGGTKLGARFDADLRTYHEVWAGERVDDAQNPLVPAATVRVPVLIGGFHPAAIRRAVSWGVGYISGTVPSAMVEPLFIATRQAWAEAGREGDPRLVATAYASLGDGEAGVANVYDYYSVSGNEVASLIAGSVATTPSALRTVIAQFGDIGADEIIINPAIADPRELNRLSDVVL